MRRLRRRLLVALPICLPGLCLSAQVPPDCGPFAAYQQPLNPDEFSEAPIADRDADQVVTESTQEAGMIVPLPAAYLRGMRFWGVSVRLDPPPDGSPLRALPQGLFACSEDDLVPYHFVFFENDGGSPGEHVAGRGVQAVPTIRDTGFPFGPAPILEYDVTFTPPIDNTAGTIAWIGLQRGLGDPDCIFGWINEDVDNTYDDRSGGFAGDTFFPFQFDLPICLDLADEVAAELTAFAVE